MKYNIKKIRIKKGLSQKELANKSRLSQAYINELESGKKNNPTSIVLSKIASALSVSISDLIEENINNSDEQIQAG